MAADRLGKCRLMSPTRRLRRAFLRVSGRLSAKGLVRNRKGAAALEFALVGPLHLALLLAMVETGFILTKTALMDLGISEAAKQVYIGTVTSGGVGRDEIKETVCKYAGRLQSRCEENLIVELTPITDFGDVPDHEAFCQEEGAITDIEGLVDFRPGVSSSIVYMRVCLTTEVIFPGLGIGLAMQKTDSGKYEIVSSTAFMNEPF